MLDISGNWFEVNCSLVCLTENNIINLLFSRSYFNVMVLLSLFLMMEALWVVADASSLQLNNNSSLFVGTAFYKRICSFRIKAMCVSTLAWMRLRVLLEK